MIRRIRKLVEKWEPVDWIVFSYILLTSVLIILRGEWIQNAPQLLSFRIGLVAALLICPERGAAWEFSTLREGAFLVNLRLSGSFLRYAYPLLLVLFFFEEVEYTVNALYPDHPYWFESVLIQVEHSIFGGLPALQLSAWAHPLLNEFMFAAYFSYFIILIAGVTITWFQLRRNQEEALLGNESRLQESALAGGFNLAITGMTLAYLSNFLLFPLLPARGPWERPLLMEGLPSLDGYVRLPHRHRHPARIRLRRLFSQLACLRDVGADCQYTNCFQRFSSFRTTGGRLYEFRLCLHSLSLGT